MTIPLCAATLIWAIYRLFVSVLEPKLRWRLFLYRLAGIALSVFAGLVLDNGPTIGLPVHVYRFYPFVGPFFWIFFFLLFDWAAGQNLKAAGVAGADRWLTKKYY